MGCELGLGLKKLTYGEQFYKKHYNKIIRNVKKYIFKKLVHHFQLDLLIKAYSLPVFLVFSVILIKTMEEEL